MITGLDYYVIPNTREQTRNGYQIPTRAKISESMSYPTPDPAKPRLIGQIPIPAGVDIIYPRNTGKYTAELHPEICSRTGSGVEYVNSAIAHDVASYSVVDCCYNSGDRLNGRLRAQCRLTLSRGKGLQQE